MDVSPASSRTRHHRETAAFRKIVIELGKLVRSLRRARRWTIEEAAERFGVEPAYVRLIEGGRTNPSLAVIVSVAQAFGLNAADLLKKDVQATQSSRR